MHVFAQPYWDPQHVATTQAIASRNLVSDRGSEESDFPAGRLLQRDPERFS